MKNISLLHVLAVVVLLTTFVACDKENKIGSTVKGTRIAVLENAKGVQPDKDVQDQKPQLSEPLANKNWPQVGYDTAHVLPNANVASHPQEVWRSYTGGSSESDFKLLARPVVSDGHVFTMGADGLVRAFDTKYGDKLWEFDTTPEDSDEGAIGGGVGVEGDTVYATTGFGEVVALGVSDGHLKWRHKLINPLRAAPTIADGRVYVVSIDNELQALDANTGEPLWHHNGIAESATLLGASNPAVVGDSVIIAYSSGEIFNLRAENGRASWNYALTMPAQVGALPAIADIRGLPVIDRGRVYAVSHSGRMAAIDQRTGDRAWEADIGGIDTPVVSGDTVFVLSSDNHVIALTRESGRVIWTHELQRYEDPDDHDSDPVLWTGPVLAGNRLWLSNSLKQLVAFSPDDGHQSDVIELTWPSAIPPVVADGTFYILTDGGYLEALR